MFDFLSNIGRALYNFLPQEQPEYGGGLDWGKIGAAGSAGLGTFGLISNALEANRRKKMQEQYFKAASTPADPNQFYRPMTDIEQRMLRNALAAELQGRSVPMDSAYASGSIAESMAKTEGDRFLNAAKLAEAAKQNQLAGYAGVGNLSPGPIGTADPFAGLAALNTRNTLRRTSAGMQPNQPIQLTADVQNPNLGQRFNFGIGSLNNPMGEDPYNTGPTDELTTFYRDGGGVR